MLSSAKMYAERLKCNIGLKLRTEYAKKKKKKKKKKLPWYLKYYLGSTNRGLPYY